MFEKFNFVKKIIGSRNERELKRIAPIVVAVNSFDEKIRALSDAELKAKTPAFKEKIGRAHV